MRTPRPSNRPGTPERAFTLIECLVYIGVLAVVLGLAYAAFYRCWDNSLGVRRNAEDIERALQAGERWRADVRQATGPISVEQTERDQVLHLPQPRGEVRYLFSHGQVQRQAGSDAPQITILPQVQSSRMQADRRQRVRAWRWELELPVYHKGARIRPLFTFEAVPNQMGQP